MRNVHVRQPLERASPPTAPLPPQEANCVGFLAEGLAFGAIAVAIRLVHLDHAGTYDEYYHTLAARALAGDELLRATFHYDRAWQLSWTIALLFRWLGDSLWVARLPALAAGAGSVTAVYFAGRAAAGRWAGRIAAGLLCLDPIAITLAQLARFYTLHTLAFLVASLALYRATGFGDRPSARAAWVAVGVAGLAFAYSLYDVTGIGVAALFVWAALDPDVQRTVRSSRVLQVSLGLALALAAALVFTRFGGLAGVLRQYRQAPLFLADERSDFVFYLRFLDSHFPVLCGALPLAVLMGLRSIPRFTLFAAVVFGVALALHSGAGPKAERYISWAMPFYYLLLGNGAALAGGALRPVAVDGLMQLPPRHLWQALARPASAVAVALVAACAVLANPGTQMALKMLVAPAAAWPGLLRDEPPSDWGAARESLLALSRERCALVSSAGVKSLYTLGRLDYDLLRTVRDETPAAREFDRDVRTGAPVISEAASLARIRAEHASGIVVVERVHWRHPAYVPAEAADALEAEFTPHALPEAWRLLVFTWGEPGEACRPLLGTPGGEPSK